MFVGVMFNEIGRVLILFGVVLVALEILLAVIPNIPLGRLPGDIFIRRDNWSLYIPLATSVIISVGLSLLLWVIAYFLR